LEKSVGGKCATLAAQVAHITFYLEVLERAILDEDIGAVDWGYIWRTVRQVSPEEWEQLKAILEQTYRRIVTMLRDIPSWESDPHLAGA
jgi:hypothetical protein